MKRITTIRNRGLIFYASKISFHSTTLLRTKDKGLSEGNEPTLEALERNQPETWNSPITMNRIMFEINQVINLWINREANWNTAFKVNRVGKWKNSCLMLLPNIRKQRIETTGVFNALKEVFNVSWKTRQIHLWGWRNRRHNKYLRAMYVRLEKSRTRKDLLENILVPDGKLRKLDVPKGANNKYWNLAYFLITRSTVFQVLHANKVLTKERTWPGTVSWNKVLRTMEEVNQRLRSGKWMEVEVRRVWIDDDKRPLGVPTLPDRIIGSMWSNLLEFYLWDSIKYNHGYQTGKGSGTVWKQLLSRLIYYPYIWEYDLDGCFNRISHDSLARILRAIELPSWLWISLMRIQKRAPLITPASGGRVKKSLYGVRHLEIQQGAKKQFVYWDAQADQGVAQGHSLSPLLSLIVIEHCVRSWMKREEMEGSSTIGYADDGLYFTFKEFPVGTYAGFIRQWGMYLSKDKCGYVRKGWLWVKSLKFLGIMYDPFKEKLQAHTRKGSRIILERAKTFFWEGERFLGVENGIFYREGPYSKLGEWVPINRHLLAKGFKELLISVLIAALHPYCSWAVGLYWVNKGWLVWWWYGMLIGINQLMPLDYHLWLLLVTGVCCTAVGLPDLEIYDAQGETQQITWRLVLKANKLNSFLARLYNKSLADKIIPQDFKLKKEPRSLLWWLSNKEVDPHWNFESFVQTQLKPESKFTTSLLSKIEEDLDNKIDFANSSTIGCYILIKSLTETGENFDSPPSTKQLHRRLLDKFHMGGYWWYSTAKDPWNAPSTVGALTQIPRTKSRTLISLGLLDGKEKWVRQPRQYKQGSPILIIREIDWVYQLTKSWIAAVNQNRHRWIEFWPNMEQKPAVGARRVYKQYRVHTILDRVHGFVPVIRKKFTTCGKPPATNHKFAMVVPVGGTTVYEIRPSLLFKRPGS